MVMQRMEGTIVLMRSGHGLGQEQGRSHPAGEGCTTTHRRADGSECSLLMALPLKLES